MPTTPPSRRPPKLPVDPISIPPGDNDELRLLTVKEAAVIIGFSAETLRKWIAQNRLPYRRIGSQIRFTRADLRAWIEANAADPNNRYCSDSDVAEDAGRRSA